MLPSSGPISLLDMRIEYQAGNVAISLSELYRGGSYVPSTISEGGWSPQYNYGYDRVGGNFVQYSANQTTGQTFTVFFLSGTQVANVAGYATQAQIGSSIYYMGAYVTQEVNDAKGETTVTNFYGILAQFYVVQDIGVNSMVPPNGEVSFDNYYGGRKS